MNHTALNRAKKRKVRRVVLGVGNPWFSHKHSSIEFDCVYLTPGAGAAGSIPLKFRNVGNWNKVRLVLEILK